MAKFKPGQSGNLKGKPKGAKSRYTKAREALANDLPGLLDATKKAALGGDMTAMKLLLERSLPVRKAVSPPVQLPGLERTGNIVEKAEVILAAIGSGDLPADIGTQLINSLGTLGALKEIHEFEMRIEGMERQMKASRKS